MSLTIRFSTLLLATLGLTLVGFSTALYVSSSVYLNRQVDDRLSAVLSLLSTAAEPRPGWVRWEPRERRLPASRWNERDATTWTAYDSDGRRLTSPKNLVDADLTPQWAPQVAGGGLPDRLTDRKGRAWRVAQRRVLPSGPPEPGLTAADKPKATPDGKSYHDSILLAAFGSLDETEGTLATLAWFLLSISTVIWLAAALSARWLSRTILVPLTRMVESARGLDATTPGWSLADAGTRDELDELRHAFNDLLARLHEAYDRQRRFSSEASHQLRTPVAVMIGHLEVAQRYERSGEQYRHVIQLAHRRAVELGQIVESLLFLGRADSASLTQLGPIDLSRWLSEHLESRPEHPRACDILINGSTDSPLWIRAQPHLLAQALDNLLDNACKYSRAGTPIILFTARQGELAVLSIADSGFGIAPQELPRIFEPFYRSPQPSRERVPGVGLGLSVVQRIVHAFGGTVRAESEPGRGSRFEVRLPVTDSPLDHFDRHQDLRVATNTARASYNDH